MAAYHNPAKPLKSFNGADPFVIAMAKDAGWIVVADAHPGSAREPKIPFLCESKSVPWLTFQQLILAEG
jgi:Domain of unknown function (DUF4411)